MHISPAAYKRREQPNRPALEKSKAHKSAARIELHSLLTAGRKAKAI
jgi:hypothetical protein